ncbi:MAG: GNAT family N-acetyltransferase [Hyphomonadaceae bacterium]
MIDCHVHTDGYELSDDRSRFDKQLILDFLTNSYWAKDSGAETIWIGIEGSAAYGLYTSAGAQVGFVRVITDGALFARIGHLFVLEEWRGKGLGVWVMKTLLEDSCLSHIPHWQLSTKDAHNLYERFGFALNKENDMLMSLERGIPSGG